MQEYGKYAILELNPAGKYVILELNPAGKYVILGHLYLWMYIKGTS